jgi:uncharacterized phosphosugar-binding protein
MLADVWLKNAQNVMNQIAETQKTAIDQAAAIMADSIAAGRWVHTFGCGHATIPVEEMYPRIGGFVGFHPIIELSLTFFTRIVGEMGINQFLFLERAEGFGKEIMKSYDFDPRDSMWFFSHSGINQVNIDMAIEAKKLGMKIIAVSSVEGYREVKTRHSSGSKLIDIADVVIDSCVPAQDASVSVENHRDKIGPVSTIGFVTVVWMVIASVAEQLVERGEKLYIHPSHNVPGDTTARDRLDDALAEYKRRITGV